jgi:tRNA threonylcarbamoyladenosine biosynthesis protein TsaE
MEASHQISPVVFPLKSPGETRVLAACLGRVLRVGDVIALTGPLGAGKTTFVQGLAMGLDVPASRHVASPTFALANEHPGRISFVHVDFYRIRNAAELPELGLEEAFDRAATAIEWAERFPDHLPADVLRITLAVEPDGRRLLQANATGPRSAELLEVLRRAREPQ